MKENMRKKIMLCCAYCGWHIEALMPMNYNPKKPIRAGIICESCGRDDGIREVQK